jgi:hypothetical protein
LFRCIIIFQTYTWESSLADITYLPFAAKQAEIWLLVFWKPETEKSEESEILLGTCNRNIIRLTPTNDPNDHAYAKWMV